MYNIAMSNDVYSTDNIEFKHAAACVCVCLLCTQDVSKNWKMKEDVRHTHKQTYYGALQ